MYLLLGISLLILNKHMNFLPIKKLKPVFIYFFRKYLTDDLSLLQGNI